MVDVLASVGGRCSRAGENEGKVWPWKVGDSREQSVHRSYSPSHVDGRALTQPNGNSSIQSSSIQKAPIFDMSKTPADHAHALSIVQQTWKYNFVSGFTPTMYSPRPHLALSLGSPWLGKAQAASTRSESLAFCTMPRLSRTIIAYAPSRSLLTNFSCADRCSPSPSSTTFSGRSSSCVT